MSGAGAEISPEKHRKLLASNGRLDVEWRKRIGAKKEH